MKTVALLLLLTACAGPTPTAAPTLPDGMQIGVAYPLTVGTHCGLRPIQIGDDWWTFDGDYPWVNNPPDGFDGPSDDGTITFVTPTTAIYTSSHGVQRRLTRGGEPPGGCL